MKYSVKSQKNISSFALKQYFLDLLSNELNNCRFNIILRFESTIKECICSLKFSSNKRLDVCVNVSYVKKSINNLDCSLISKIHYCAWFISDYIRQIERAKNYMPQNYFESLVFFNAIDIYKSTKTVNINSPLYNLDKKPHYKYCIRPIEINCAINSLNRMKICMSSEIKEKDLIDILLHKLSLYASLPEIVYANARTPIYTLVDCFRKISTIISNDPYIVQEFPVLMSTQFEKVNQLTTAELLLSCIQSKHDFLIGVAIRIMAYLQFPNELKKDVFEKLVNGMIQYIEYSLKYYKLLSNSNECFFKDNLYAIKKAVKVINNCLNMYGYNINSGNIHSIE